MMDTRELQEQLVEAARKGQQQAKKAREQVRSTRQAVTEAVGTLTTAAEAFRPQLPSIQLPPLPNPPRTRLPSSEALMASAQELADQVLAVQRNLARQVAQTAGPLIADGLTQGAARLSQAARLLRTATPGPSSEPAEDGDEASGMLADNTAAYNAAMKAATADTAALAHLTGTKVLNNDGGIVDDAGEASPAAATGITSPEPAATAKTAATAKGATPKGAKSGVTRKTGTRKAPAAKASAGGDSASKASAAKASATTKAPAAKASAAKASATKAAAGTAGSGKASARKSGAGSKKPDPSQA